ncbi:MAG TPA: hypothetical protein ENJ28_03580 [Gammaproteobacteria bacterium]|nr:hypothetical protein [Gammaproteobacteria bacterium]
MGELTKIEKAISAIDTAKKIFQGLTKGVADLKDVEVRATFIELKSALVDSQETILNVKQEFDAKDQEIQRLKEAFKLKDSLVLFAHHGHYHKADENGEPYGVPYCSRCWEVDHKAVSVSRKSKCPECGAELWRAVPLNRNKENY